MGGVARFSFFVKFLGDCESAKTRVDCEKKLAELIKTMKAEIAEMKKATKNA